MEHKFCQSCGIPLTTDNKGTNADGSRNEDYCIYCYKDGRFTQDFTMEQMIEHCAQFTDEINKESGQTLTQEQAKDMMRQFFPQLKRWKNRTAMFIAILTYKKPLEEVDRFLQAHRDYLAEHYAAGDFIASGPQTPRVGGVIMIKSDNRALVDSIIAQDPFNINGIADYRIVEFTPICRIEPFRHTKISIILMVNKRAIIIWLAITILVMLALPFAVARLASECSGMALCMMLFLIVNPVYSAILGYRCGKDIKKMWNLPLVSAVAFLAGTWIFFDIHELWFIVYATVYLAIGWIAMAISKYINGSNKRNDIYPFSDAPNTAVFICSHILDRGEDILFVSHDADDGAWQFLCGKEHNESDARIVSLKYVLDLDPTIVNLKDLPLGYCAERKSKNDKWVIAKN